VRSFQPWRKHSSRAAAVIGHIRLSADFPHWRKVCIRFAFDIKMDTTVLMRQNEPGNYRPMAAHRSKIDAKGKKRMRQHMSG
jgi:hypothetical protein